MIKSKLPKPKNTAASQLKLMLIKSNIKAGRARANK
jgi:hypothetical protein